MLCFLFVNNHRPFGYNKFKIKENGYEQTPICIFNLGLTCVCLILDTEISLNVAMLLRCTTNTSIIIVHCRLLCSPDDTIQDLKSRRNLVYFVLWSAQ